MDLNLEDKVIVITGASRGIGRELIKAFAYENSKIVINYFKSEYEAESLYKELITKSSNCIKVKADVTKIDDVILLKNETIAAFGKVDVLINNAGICDDNNIQLMTEEQWKRVIDVNLTGVYLCCKIFSQIMIKQNKGKIINISSLKGQEGCAGQTNYSASKAGLIGFSKALAKELGEFNISVNTICPGFIVTDFNRKRLGKKRIAEERSLLSIDMNLQDVVNFILFSASSRMLSVSGQVFNIDSRM
jgi:3-oxoacyl-[acyl-carrier protein] reductase